MKRDNHLTIAVAAAATIVVSSTLLPSCQGRKMSNMEPTGDTVEVVIGQGKTSADTPDSMQESRDTIPQAN